MSRVTITSETSGWEDLIKELFKNVGRAQKLLAVAAQAFAFQDIIQHFSDESGPDGPWQPRSEKTQFRYAMIQAGNWKAPFGMAAGSFSPTNKLLQLTGNMRKMLVPTNIEEVGDDAIRIFDNAIYSARHNYGDPSSGTPQREFMWLSDTANQKMADAISQMIVEGESGGGL